MVFNPSSVHRLVHVWLGALILGAFFVMSISAWYFLRGRHLEFAKRSFTGALLLGTLASLGQLVSGHFNAEMVAEHQPAKLAAMEAHFRTGQGGAPLYLVGWPDEATSTVHGVSIPGMLSFLIHQDANRPVPGLDQLEPRYGSPPVWLVFQAYHIMVGLGMLFILTTLAAWIWWLRGTLFQTRWWMWYFVFAILPAFASNELGWIVAEVGRQPWIVYPVDLGGGELVGGLRTSAGVSEAVRAEMVLGSIIMFAALYTLLFILWVYLLNRTIQQGPGSPAGAGEPPRGERPLVTAATSLAARRESLSGPRREGT
jgi:cytochrome d ubiquinol oxidase subunit I